MLVASAGPTPNRSLGLGFFLSNLPISEALSSEFQKDFVAAMFFVTPTSEAQIAFLKGTVSDLLKEILVSQPL